MELELDTYFYKLVFLNRLKHIQPSKLSNDSRGMKAKEKYNDKWIGYLFIPFAGIFAYYIGKDDVSLNTNDFIYIVLNIVAGLIVWQMIRKIIFSLIKEEITLALFLKAFFLNLSAGLSFLLITRFLHDIFIIKIQTKIEFYTLDLPTDALFIFIINLIYLILFYKRKVEQKQNHTITEPDASQKIVIQSSKKSYALTPSDIAFIELEHKITFLYTYSGEKIVTVHSLNQIFQKLPKTIFFLANRQFVLHREVIQSYQLTDTRKLKIELVPALDFNKEIFVSKAKSHAFKNWFLDHQQPKDKNI